MESRFVIATSDNCCGCGACKAVCPVNAIKMVEDDYGFIMPVIDHELCVNCGKCSKVCHFFSPEKYISKDLPIKSFAAANKNDELLRKSASGGVFSGVAQYFLDNGGIVFGAAMQKDYSVRHIGIDSDAKLHFLQGSKYTQSDSSGIFLSVKMQLEKGKKVLFSGTPCQCAALYSFLGKEYMNLYTMDLVCHGVGSNRMFVEDVEHLGKKYKSPIKSISFRSKRKGWGTEGDLVLEKKIKDYNPANSPYYYYYLDSSIFRDSCYYCPYATQKRVGDITIGDFWRIETLYHNNINTDKGVSCLIVNTPKGMDLIEKIQNLFILYETEYDEIVRRNGNLNHASVITSNRKKIFDIYSREGYSGIVDYYNRTTRMLRLKYTIKGMIPKRIKKLLKRVLL